MYCVVRVVCKQHVGAVHLNTMLVIGPPGGGKTTLVKKRMREGDIAIDQDAIFAALTLSKKKPGGLVWIVNKIVQHATREAVLNAPGLVWIITTNPLRVNDFSADDLRGIILVVPSPATCESRAKNRGDNDMRAMLVHGWWEKFGPWPITHERAKRMFQFFDGGTTLEVVGD